MANHTHIADPDATASTASGIDFPASAGISLVAVFASHEAAEEAVRALDRAGFDMRRLSIIGKDYRTEERPIGFYNLGDRVRVWGARGAFWGALIGLLASPAFFLIPLVGHVIVLGPLTTALVGTLEGAAIGGGASALAGALASIGVPRDSIIRYEAAIRADKFVLIVHGAADRNADMAERVLSTSGAESVEQV